MSRKRQYSTDAERQKAYRQRKKTQNVTPKPLRNDFDEAIFSMKRLVFSGRERSARAVVIMAVSHFSDDEYRKLYEAMPHPEQRV